MLDMDIYLATRDSPSGPLLLLEEPPSTVLDIDERPRTKGEAIGGLIGIGLFLALGTYLFTAL